MHDESRDTRIKSLLLKLVNHQQDDSFAAKWRREKSGMFRFLSRKIVLLNSVEERDRLSKYEEDYEAAHLHKNVRASINPRTSARALPTC